MSDMHAAAPFDASGAVSRCLGGIGRTEDIHFSPDQTRLAIAGFRESKILVLDLQRSEVNGALSVSSRRCMEISSVKLQLPHGLFWIDDGAMIVANRGGDVVIFPVPPLEDEPKSITVDPLLEIEARQPSPVRTPGSVSVAPLGDGFFDVLVCNNYTHLITRHIVRRLDDFQTIASVPLLTKDLQIPDGVAFGCDGCFIAVSNHDKSEVVIFPNCETPDPTPVCHLKVRGYPHGLRFSADGSLLFVADARAPVVHVFHALHGEWAGAKEPALSLRVMDNQTFRRGKKEGPEEGGPKGIDISRDGRLLAVTCEQMPLAFFDISQLRRRLGCAEYEKPAEMASARIPNAIVSALSTQHDIIRKAPPETNPLAFRQVKEENARLHRLVARPLSQRIRDRASRIVKRIKLL